MSRADLDDNDLFQAADQIDRFHWDELNQRNPEKVALRCGARWIDGAYRIGMLGREFAVDPTARLITGPPKPSFEDALVLLVYLASQGPGGISGQRRPPIQLPGGALFFAKTHTPATDDLPGIIDLDAAGFARAGEVMGGRATGQGDASWLIMALPNLPIEGVFFQGDEEFPSQISLLIDDAVTNYMDLGTLWGLINLLSHRIKDILKEERS